MRRQLQPVTSARSILDAACVLFARDGFDAVSIAQIADQAHVSKANVFHHFRSKQALYIDVMREASIGHAEFAERLLQLDLSSAEKLRCLAAWEFEDNARNEGRVRMLVREVFSGCRTEVLQLARQVFRRNYLAVIELFAQGQSRGEFRSDFSPAVAATMFGATSAMYAQTREGLRQFPEFPFADDPVGYANAVCDLLLPSIVAVEVRKPARSQRPVPAARKKTPRSQKK